MVRIQANCRINGREIKLEQNFFLKAGLTSDNQQLLKLETLLLHSKQRARYPHVLLTGMNTNKGK